MSGGPSSESWDRVDPAAAGMDADGLRAAVGFAEAHDSVWPRSLTTPGGEFYVTSVYVSEPVPWNEVLGPITPRGGPNGVVLRHGRVVAEWGDTGHADMTFSVAKSFLALLAGLAVADGLIRDIDARVSESALDDGFDTPHNREITWRHLLQQTSEWEGTLWGKPDTIDRNRQVGAGAIDNAAKGAARALRPPGTFWEYNDVRVNRLSLALLRVFRRALPEVLDERVMRPIGTSDTWRWQGYRNSTVEIDGASLVSVPGGGHWGGGLVISARDLARVGLLVHRRGAWNGKELLPASWIDRLRTRAPGNPCYGFLWWLNTERGLYPSAPASSLFALGGGSHVLWLDADHDLVMVARWIDKLSVDGLIAQILAAVTA
jgi:CubicO group peptidase (beta-lactamase class C family)